MNETHFPNLPFAATSAAPKQTMDLASILAAGRAAARAESAERDADHLGRERQLAVLLQQAELERQLAAQVERHDGFARLERGRGNRKFVLGVAKGACAAAAAIVLVEVLLKLGRP